MSAGLRVDNANGYVQIDSEFRNWSLVDKYQLTLTGASTGARGYAFCKNSRQRSTSSVIAYRSSVPIAENVGGIYVRHEDQGAVVTAYVFDTPPTSGVTSGGLEVYTAAGQLAFWSGYKYMRVAGQQDLGGPRESGTNQGYPDKVYALLLVGVNPPFVFYNSDPGDGNPESYSGAYAVSRGIAWAPINSSPRANTGQAANPDVRANYLLLDVSSY